MSDLSGLDMLVVLFVVSFALDRIVTGILFVLSWVQPWARLVPDPRTVKLTEDRVAAERRSQLAYFAIAAVLAILVLGIWGDVRLFKGLNQSIPAPLDVLVTAVILIGGSEFVGKLLQFGGVGSAEAASSTPVEITGRLIIEDSSERITTDSSPDI